MLIVGTNSNGQVLINGHNKDAYRYPLTLSNKIYYTIEFTHCYNNVVSQNSTKHSLSCVLCGTRITEGHTFAVDISGMSTCVRCGYSK